MLHEILLSLSGHPSPLLRADAQSPALADVSPPERELLATAAHISDLNIKLRSYTAQISSDHPSAICRAVASAIGSIHLAAFQRKVLEVEESILLKDVGLVGAYNIVPLTAVIGEFTDWTRRLEWLWDIAQFVLDRRDRDAETPQVCRGARLIDRLRADLQSGYVDIEETAASLVAVAETAWLKQVSAWILYGRLPSYGEEDFFVQAVEDGDDQDFITAPDLLPKFVFEPTASSMLFIGKALNYVRVKGSNDSGLSGLCHLSSQLKELSALTLPLDPASFSRTISSIRLNLSRNTLQKLLPLSRVVEILELLRDFFLLGRGEFAMALTQQADEKLRSRWKRADNLAHEKNEGPRAFAVKEGEVSAVLGKTWAAMGLMQGQHAEEDEGLELARDLLRLKLAKTRPETPSAPGLHPSQHSQETLASTPFQNLLLSVPVVLMMQIPSPLDMFLGPSDMQTYSAINAYLLSIRRAHIRLTNLWKMTSLRRHHPAPPSPPAATTRGGRAQVQLLRERNAARSDTMRSAWVTASATVFLLAETEAYLQTDVVAGLWDGFYKWLTRCNGESPDDSKARFTSQANSRRTSAGRFQHKEEEDEDDDNDNDDDIWLAQSTSNVDLDTTKASKAGSFPPHDPESLATAHARYLAALSHCLLLTCQSYTDALMVLLVNIDRLAALVERLHGIWTSMDLEADAGVVDAFANLDTEEGEVRNVLKEVEGQIKRDVESVVAALRAIEADDPAFVEEVAPGAGTNQCDPEAGEGAYVPRHVGGVDRLLMKLNFGGWFGGGGNEDDEFGATDHDD